MLLLPFPFPRVSSPPVGLLFVLFLLIRWRLFCAGYSCIVGYVWLAGSLGAAGLGLSIAASIGGFGGLHILLIGAWFLGPILFGALEGLNLLL